MKSPKILFVTFICLLFATLTANADTIKLKNGTVVKGKVISFTNSSFTVALDLGNSSQSSRAILDIRDVETIEFDGRSDDGNRASQPGRETTVPRPSAPDDDTGHKASNTASARPLPVLSKPSPSSSNSSVENRPSPTSSSASAKEIVAVVPAKDDWTYSNLTVRRGDRVRLSASGRVKISSSKEAGPEGVELEDRNKLLLDQPTGGLIAVIGDDNDEFIYVGRENEFVAKRDGKLFLSVNEGDLTDNNGSFNVRVKVEPSK